MKLLFAVVLAIALVLSFARAERDIDPSKLKAATIINPLETNEVHHRTKWVSAVLLNEPAAAKDPTGREDWAKEEDDAGIDDAALMGDDDCSDKLPSEQKTRCQRKHEAKIRAQQAAEKAAEAKDAEEFDA